MSLANPFVMSYRKAMAAAWRPHEPMDPAAWAERYRVLSDKVSSEPGPYRLDRTPYARGILQALGGRYTEVVVQAPGQSGKSEIGRNWLAWSADLDPGPMMIVFPTQQSAEDNMEERIMPMFRDSPRLRRLLTARLWDVKKSRMILGTCTINIGWAGSPNALAARPERRILLDEVNKNPPYKGKEADGITNARKRVESYGHRGQVYIVSTPTIPTGQVTKAYESCVDRRTYQCPCPKCGAFAEFDWDQVTWEGREESDEGELREQRAALEAGLIQAFYECESCGYLIKDSERWPMVQRGEWVSDGYPRGQHPEALSIGFRINGLATPWTSFSGMALKFVTAKLKGIAEMQGFYNSDLGLPFWGVTHDATQLVEVKAETIQRKASKGRGRKPTAPAWATHIIGSADPGKIGAPFVIRAWGKGFWSTLLAFGEAPNLAALNELVLERELRSEDGHLLRVSRMLIDVGGGRGTMSQARTDEIYRYAKTKTGLIFPTKGYGGAGRPQQPVLTRSHTYHPPGEQAKAYDVTMSSIDTEYFKDITAGRIEAEEEVLWGIGCEVSVDYVLQVAAEKKGLVERKVKPDGTVTEVFRWAPRVVGVANHFWDCEVLQSVGAYMIDMDRGAPPPAQSWPSRVPSIRTGY